MPRARTKNNEFQTAATPSSQGSGCLSGFILPPLSVMITSALLAVIAFRNPISNIPSTSSPISSIFTVEVKYWSGSISRWAAGVNLDPNLVATIMQIESCGDPRALSGSGAMGLFQVMPFHFQATDDPYDPDTNAARGLAYLIRALEKASGDPRLSLAGYNGGLAMLGRPEWAWPEQTQRYVQYGWPIYLDARNGIDASQSLAGWHKKYGAGLCRQAHQRLKLP